MQRYTFDLECDRAGVPIYNTSGSHFVGPVIIHYGTPEQRAKYLPRIRSGEDYWAQGYSEPGSGSDLASIKTRAVTDRDDYVVTGQKIWTTMGTGPTACSPSCVPPPPANGRTESRSC